VTRSNHLGPGQPVVLDLAGVEFIDSSGLRVPEQARGVLTADGGSLILRNPSEAAHRLLAVTETEDNARNTDPAFRASSATSTFLPFRAGR
jgi:anti-anti-sigma factor